ncbi:Uncharacterized protein Adt_44688 [Abeliophyllum distichum]|uniref:Uncharacterized protein n=1 Tax=Abeliophyllum distichum TaxID=126358 RepID=A0ABD1PBL6_9LAMI
MRNRGNWRKWRVRVIHVIVGRSAAGEDLRNARKGYARSLQINSIGVSSIFGQSITFDDIDLLEVSFLCDDALVITRDIADFDIKRVLVDMGTMENVLSWEV